MISSIKSISLVLLLLLLAGFFTPTAFSKEKSKDSVSSSMASSNRAAGKLMICPSGVTCIQFLTSHKAFEVGELIVNELPLEAYTTDQADQHVLQKAAYEAYNAWLKCEEAKELFKKGKLPKVQMEWTCAFSDKLAAKELFLGTNEILGNLGSKQVEWAAPSNAIAKLDYENAIKEEQNAIDNGAVPTPLGYEPPGEGQTPPIDFSDPTISNKVVIDSVPTINTVTAVPFNDNVSASNSLTGVPVAK